MGFFGFLRKVKPADAVSEVLADAEAKETSFEDASETVRKRLSDRMARESERAEELYDMIKENLIQIRKTNSELRGKKFESGQRIDAPVNMIKDNYVKKSISLLGSIPNVDNFEYDEVTGFCSASEKILSDLMNIPPKQALLLSRYFKGETSKMIRLLKEADERRKEMSSLLRGSAIGLYSRVNAGVAGITGLLEKSKDLGTSEKKLREKIADRQKDIEGRRSAMESLLSGEESRKHAELGEEIKRMEHDRSELGNKLNDELSGLKRPVKKLEHSAAKETKDKEKLALYSRLSHSPLKVLLQEQGDSLIMDALGKLRELGLKDEDREHVEELAKKIELGYLSKLADKYKWLDGEIADRKSAFEKSEFPERHKKHEREIENLGREISEMTNDLEKILKAKSDTRDKIKAEKSKLEGMILKEAGIRLDITLGD